MDLRSRDRWVSWLPSKRPIQLDGSSATSTDPRTWTSYSRIRGAERKGFVLGEGIGCIDLDHCLEGSKLTPAAAAFVARMPTTYTEISPSGTGLHLWFRMSEAPGSRRRIDGLSIETYSRARYITVTGRRLNGSPNRLADYAVSPPDAVGGQSS